MGSRKTLVWFALAVVLVAGLAITLMPAHAWAQEPAAAAQQPEAPKSFFLWICYVSGLIGVVILCLSIYFVATVSRLFFEFRPVVTVPPEIVGQVEDLLAQRDFKGVFNTVKEDDSFFSRALSTGITELPNGLAEARDVMDRVGDSITVEMEKKISMLAVLGTLGPMIGLLGTLKGMIGSFSAIGMSHGEQVRSDVVATKISEALVLTFEGVMLSVPAIYFFALFRNRVAVLSQTAMLSADQFLRHFAHAARTKAAPAAAKPAAKA
jgi:biopolymer transport protein ExbB